MKNKSPQTNGSVRLIPMNEGHEIAYAERFNGTGEKIFARTNEILSGLSNLLPKGSWMIKIESDDVREAIYLDETNVYDDDFKIIGENAEKVS